MYVYVRQMQIRPDPVVGMYVSGVRLPIKIIFSYLSFPFSGVEVTKRPKMKNKKTSLTGAESKGLTGGHKPIRGHVNLLVDFRFWMFCIFSFHKWKIKTRKRLWTKREDMVLFFSSIESIDPLTLKPFSWKQHVWWNVLFISFPLLLLFSGEYQLCARDLEITQFFLFFVYYFITEWVGATELFVLY